MKGDFHDSPQMACDGDTATQRVRLWHQQSGLPWRLPLFAWRLRLQPAAELLPDSLRERGADLRQPAAVLLWLRIPASAGLLRLPAATADLHLLYALADQPWLFSPASHAAAVRPPPASKFGNRQARALDIV